VSFEYKRAAVSLTNSGLVAAVVAADSGLAAMTAGAFSALQAPSRSGTQNSAANWITQLR
jgi:hypothetical protein